MKRTIGIIGGGQLARMVIEYGIRRLDPICEVFVLNGEQDCSVSALNDENVHIIVGDLNNINTIHEFCKRCSVITWDIESVNPDFIRAQNVATIPSVDALEMIQDKGVQKKFFADKGFSVVDHFICDAGEDPNIVFWNSTDKVASGIRFATDTVVYKLAKGGFDGRGVWIVHGQKNAPRLPPNSKIIIERYMSHIHEISVFVCKKGDTIIAYDAVSMKFHEEQPVLNEVFPAIKSQEDARRFAEAIVSVIPGDGVFAIEMFVSQSGDLYLNEIAGRVHNSYHHTIHTHDISQFEMDARLLLDYPIRAPIVKYPNFVMRNMFVSSEGLDFYMVKNHLCVLSNEKGPFVVDYQKRLASKWRKIGHITHVGHNQNQVEEEAQYYQIQRIVEFIHIPKNYKPPVVGVIMGSQSDWSIMSLACEMLTELHVPFEVTVVSAHRTPDRLVQYAKTCESRGIRVVIAGAGGSAHLPGMIAANTATTTVIGVPIKLQNLDGIDSLYSIVQMPASVPVACVAINGSKNAAILAAQILGDYHNELLRLRREASDMVMETASFRNIKKNY